MAAFYLRVTYLLILIAEQLALPLYAYPASALLAVARIVVGLGDVGAGCTIPPCLLYADDLVLYRSITPLIS